jgi:hypothetical protein
MVFVLGKGGTDFESGQRGQRLPFSFLVEQRAYEKSNWRRHGREDEVDGDREWRC